VFSGVAADIDLEAEFEGFGGGGFEEWHEFFAIDGLDNFDKGEDFFDFISLEWADEVAAVVCEVEEVGFEVGPAVFGEVADFRMAGEHGFDFLWSAIFDDGTNLHSLIIANFLLQCYCNKGRRVIWNMRILH